MAAEGQKVEKKPRPAAPPPPAALATASVLVRGAVAKVLGLRLGPASGDLQPLWVAEPGHAKVTISFEDCARTNMQKDESYVPLLEAIETATNELVKSGVSIAVFDIDRVTAEELYGTTFYDVKSTKEDVLRLAYVPGAALVEVPKTWRLCSTTSGCGHISFQKAVPDPESKKKPETMISYKKKQVTVRFEVAENDTDGAEPQAKGFQPPADDVQELNKGTVRVSVPGVDTEVTVSPTRGNAPSDPTKDASTVPAAVGEAAAEGEEMVVDPWKVEGKIDYTKLINQFGSTEISPELLERIKRLTVGRGHVKELHPWLRRGIFFSHRDLDLLCNLVEQGKPFYLYTGRGPSSLAMHLGHLIPFMMTKWLQDAFQVPLVIQMTDDEKFLWKGEWDVETGQDNLKAFEDFTIENCKDIISVGFDKSKTFIFSDCEYVGHMYRNIVRIWKAVTYNTARSSFGFQGDNNIGQSAFPAVQAAPSFPSSFPIPLGGQTNMANMACLIPCAIDQDPYFRITRDIAHKLVPRDHPLKGKPALLHAKFFPPLQGAQGKMSASDDNSAIFLTDGPEAILQKIKQHAFSGGQVTAKEQKEKGADLDVDVPYQWLRFFLEDDAELARIGDDYGSGTGEYWNTGSVKDRLVKELQAIVSAHQERRAKVTDHEVREWMTVRELKF